MLALLLVAIAAPIAHADSTPYGTYTVECIGPCASDPTVTFTPTTIDFTAFGGTVPFSGLSLVPGHLFGWDIENDVLTLTDVTTDSLIVAPVTLNIARFSAPPSNEQGLFLPATIPAPEPSSVALMLLGVGLVFVVRKRTGAGLSRAS